MRSSVTPVQFIVPLRDGYVGPALLLAPERCLGRGTVHEDIDAGHRVVLRDPAAIAARIDRFAAQHHVQRSGNGRRLKSDG